MAKREPQTEAADQPKQPATRYVVFKVLPNSALVKIWTGDAWSRKQAADRAGAGKLRGKYAVCASSAMEVFTFGVPDDPPIQLLGSSDASELEIVRSSLEQPVEPPIPPPADPTGEGDVPTFDSAKMSSEEASARVAAAIPGGELKPDLSGPDDDEAGDDAEAAEGQVVPLNE